MKLVTHVHVLCVTVPPPPPNIEMLSAGWNNVTLQWMKAGASELLGYILRYRKFGLIQDQWIETRLTKHFVSYSVGGLDCGTVYQFSLAAYNMVGEGDAGPAREVRTLGDEPRAPAVSDAVSSSTLALTLHLERWLDGGCPISHFVLECRTLEQNWSIGSYKYITGSVKYTTVS
jgi:hypothetical protein